jgi:integrase
LRVGELLALQWRDIDFENLEISVTRSISLQHIGDCKTEASRKPIPMDAELAEALWRWRHNSGYPKLEDWIFASPANKGKLPYWSFSIFRVYIRPALKAAKITGKVGMAYLPSFPGDDFEVAWRRCEDSAGATAACKQ